MCEKNAAGDESKRIRGSDQLRSDQMGSMCSDVGREMMVVILIG